MRIGVPSQAAAGEPRVALVPDVIRRLAQHELEIVVESGAGEGSHLPGAYAYVPGPPEWWVIGFYVGLAAAIVTRPGRRGSRRRRPDTSRTGSP